MKLTNEEVLQYLKTASLEKFSVGNGDISSDDGWYFNYYDDCGEIDYIERVKSPDGRELSYDDINEQVQAVFYCMFEHF
jgi:hypothetical protein